MNVNGGERDCFIFLLLFIDARKTELCSPFEKRLIGRWWLGRERVIALRRVLALVTWR